MEKLKVKKITLDSDGVLKVETNISDNFELAKHIDKDKMEKCLNHHLFEMHIYQQEYSVSSISFEGKTIHFHAEELVEFLQEKRKKEFEEKYKED